MPNKTAFSSKKGAAKQSKINTITELLLLW